MDAVNQEVLVWPANHKALWWIADNKEEADQWIADLTKKGCTILKIEPHPAPSEQVDVVFSFDPENTEALDYVPEECEYLQR
jgi:hypothetical protein